MTNSTYISVEPGERLDHVKPMHVHDGGINCKLGPDGWLVKEASNDDRLITTLVDLHV